MTVDFGLHSRLFVSAFWGDVLGGTLLDTKKKTEPDYDNT
jgi:hypothetical protein